MSIFYYVFKKKEVRIMYNISSFRVFLNIVVILCNLIKSTVVFTYKEKLGELQSYINSKYKTLED